MKTHPPPRGGPEALENYLRSILEPSYFPNSSVINSFGSDSGEKWIKVLLRKIDFAIFVFDLRKERISLFNNVGRYSSWRDSLEDVNAWWNGDGEQPISVDLVDWTKVKTTVVAATSSNPNNPFSNLSPEVRREDLEGLCATIYLRMYDEEKQLDIKTSSIIK